LNDAPAAPEQPEDPSPELVGQEIDGRFRVVAGIGGGGMGSIFRVEHIELERQFAMKVLRTELSHDRGMVERFRREARAAASLASEHVVAIVDSGILPDRRPYYVMDLLVGADLRRLLRSQGPLSPARVANLGIDVCRGLTVAHRVGLIHRDLKPENLFVTRGDDGRDVCKILDFGVAKSSDIGTTRPGTLVGTLRYMAPEQIGLDAPVTPLTDLHALGVIMYECLCGAAPFEGDTTERLLYGIMNGTPSSLVGRRPELSGELVSVVMRAFSRRPEQRYPSALALAEALLPFAGGRRAGPQEAWWVDVSSDGAPVSGRHATPVQESTPAEPVPNPAPHTERSRSSFPWGAALGSALIGAAVAGFAPNVFRQREARPADIARPIPPPASPVSEAVAPPRSMVVPGTPVASRAADASLEGPPRTNSTRPTTLARPSRPAPAPPPALPRLPPSASFDFANPYAE
jgi:serine/threonine-protein kinase